MSMDLGKYVDKALNVISSPGSLKSRLEDYGRVLSGSMTKYGEVVVFKDDARYVFVGDVHGSLEDLRAVLGRYREEDLRDDRLRMVFLGDYIDRGDNQLEVLTTLLELKSDYPDSVFLLKGNHEGVDVVVPSPHDFPEELVARYLISEGLKMYELFINEVFKRLHLAVYFRDRFLALHGGLPTSTLYKAQSIREYLLGSSGEAVPDVVIEVLWNDPIESSEEAQESPRGAGMLFGRPVTDWVTRTFDVRLVIRGHEPCARGYKFNHGGRVLTIFSRTGPPYYNTTGAFLEIDTSSRNWYRSLGEAQAIRLLRR